MPYERSSKVATTPPSADRQQRFQRGHATEPDEPTTAYSRLVGLLQRALDAQASGHPQPFDAALDDLVALENDIADLDGTARGRFVKERIRRVGIELSCLTNRPAKMKRLGPRATVGEALWHVAPEPVANTDEARPDDATRDEQTNTYGITTDSNATRPPPGAAPRRRTRRHS